MSQPDMSRSAIRILVNLAKREDGSIRAHEIKPWWPHYPGEYSVRRSIEDLERNRLITIEPEAVLMITTKGRKLVESWHIVITEVVSDIDRMTAVEEALSNGLAEDDDGPPA
jgi:hypothetical protein